MYIKETYRFRSSIEYEYKFKGYYGLKGEHRAKKKERTPEYIEKQNQLQRVKKVRRLLKANFKEGDYYSTLTYKDREGRQITDVAGDVQRLLRKLRTHYKKNNVPCKYIYRVEIGSKGGIHVHIVLNRIPDLDRIIQQTWTHGKVRNELLDDGPYDKLAEYIVKQPTDQQKKLLKTFNEDVKKLIRYSCSRNLERPVPEVKTYSRLTMQKIFNSDLVPHRGFYIDKNSIRRGINDYTGYSYLYYQEIKLDTGQQAAPIRICECPICHQFTLEFIKCDCLRGKHGRKHLHRLNN